MTIDIAFHSVGHRWTVSTESPYVREYLESNGPDRSFWLNGLLWIAPEQADEIMEQLRSVGLVERQPAWCETVKEHAMKFAEIFEANWPEDEAYSLHHDAIAAEYGPDEIARAVEHMHAVFMKESDGPELVARFDAKLTALRA